MMRRIPALAVMAALAASAALAPAAVAATTPGNRFGFAVTSARLSVANLQPLALDPAMLGAAGVKPVAFDGAIAVDGTITVPQSGIGLPAVTYPIPQQLIDQLVSAAGGSGGVGSLPSVGGFDIGSLISSGQISLSVAAAITPTGPATGSFSRDTGELRLTTPVDVTVAANATIFKLLPVKLIGCSLKGLVLDLGTGTVTLPGGSSIVGSQYSEATGAATVAASATVPQPTCDSGLLATYAGSAIAGLKGTLGQIGLGLTGTVTLPPAAVATLTGSASPKLSSTGSFTTRIACSKSRACKGTAAVAYPGGAVLGSTSYSVPAGRTQTVTIKLATESKAAVRAAMKGVASMDAVVRLRVDWGSSTSSPVKLIRPSSWR